MSAEVAATTAPISPAPKKAVTPKKAKATKAAGAGTKKAAPASHPPYANMVKAAISALKESKGSSRAAILKYIVQHYKVGDNAAKVNANLRRALNNGTTSGLLKQTKGTGASGSFRLGESTKTKTAEKAKVVKKAAPKKPVAKKASPVKKAKVATKPKAAKKASAPKKAAAAKPKAAKPTKAPAAKKPKSPKKVKSPKKAAKKPATKKAATKA